MSSLVPCLHEADNSRHFDNGKDKLGFTIALDSTQVDADDDDKENGDEDGFVDGRVPI